jgi:capsular exopolysaccharide synthesis family protein
MAKLDGGALVASTNPRIQTAQDRLLALEDQEKALLASLGALHPDVVTIREQIQTARARLGAAKETEVRAANAAFDLALSEESRIETNLHRAQAELEGLEKESIDYTMSQKQVDANRLAVERLMQRQEAAVPVTTIESSLIQAAVPLSRPSSPRTRRNFSYALLGGLLGGVLLAWFLERLDDSIQSPEDVRDILGLPFLGVVPLVRQLPLQTLAGAVADARTGFADSLRVVRTNMMYGSPTQRPKVLVFTSASPGEGKSTVASGVALLLHETRARVLLIDGDLRRPSVHTLLGLPSSPGLSDLLAAAPPVRLEVTQDSPSGIDVLTAGPSLTVSAAWLGSDNMRSLLHQARQLYDWVIIDSPPSLGLPDACVLATLADAVVVVCSGDKTPRQALRSVADQLRMVGAQVQGVVLNRVDMNRHSYYYGRYYSPYYGAAEAKGPSSRAAAPSLSPSPAEEAARPDIRPDQGV